MPAKYTDLRIGPVLFGLICLTFLGGCDLHRRQIRQTSVTVVQPNPAPVAPPAQSVVDLQNAFVNVAKGVKPAVVSIQSRTVIRQMSAPELELGPSGFPFDLQAPAPTTHVAIGKGSGFIVRQDGYILTNDHVVAGADRVTVRLDDGREFIGAVKRDFQSDIALVKIPADHLPTLNLADSSKVEVGEWAIAFGSPFGLRDTMTVGVVSALSRSTLIGGSQDAARYYPDLIQTDASINPGNSGGPLLDIYGNVIGINAAIDSPTGGNVGIGFAIPSNTAKYVMDQLIANGTVTRGFLGLVPENLSAQDQTRYGVQEGALVTAITDGSPAAKSGLQLEDVITHFNDQPIHNEEDLRDAIAKATPGQTVTLTIIRDGQEQTLNAVPTAAPNPRTATPTTVPQGRLGIRIADLTPDVARRIGIDPNTQGIVVLEVVSGSSADEAGIQPGDLLLRIDGHRVNSAAQAETMIQGMKQGDTAPIILRRRNMQILVRAVIG